MEESEIKFKFRLLEQLIHKDIGKRGLNNLWTKDELYKAVKQLNAVENVLIITGFFLPSANAPETDGPPGAIALANALISLGKKVVVLTDHFCYGMINRTVKKLETDINIFNYNVKYNVRELFDKINFLETKSLAVVFIERPGKSLDGKYYNMSGQDITSFNMPLDLILEDNYFKKLSSVTIGIGDGGNEAGMGNIYQKIIKHVPYGNKIASIVKTDYLITTGVSNWGGFAVVHALKLLNKDRILNVIDYKYHEKLIEMMVSEGAVCGVSLKNKSAVDGIDILYHNKLLNEMDKISK